MFFLCACVLCVGVETLVVSSVYGSVFNLASLVFFIKNSDFIFARYFWAILFGYFWVALVAGLGLKITKLVGQTR